MPDISLASFSFDPIDASPPMLDPAMFGQGDLGAQAFASDAALVASDFDGGIAGVIDAFGGGDAAAHLASLGDLGVPADHGAASFAGDVVYVNFDMAHDGGLGQFMGADVAGYSGFDDGGAAAMGGLDAGAFSGGTDA